MVKKIVGSVNKMSNIQLSALMIGFSVVLVLVGALIVRNTSPIDTASDTTKLKVSATIFPLADIVRNVGGDRVEVIQLLPSGATPHSYELTTSQVVDLTQSDVLFAIGHGLDSWALDFADANDVPVEIVDTYIDLIESEDDHDEDHQKDREEHGEYDPHYWLSMPNGILIAQAVFETLIETYPDYAAEFSANYDTYVDDITRADIRARQSLNTKSNRRIAVFHDGWKYLERDYGVEVVAQFASFAGDEPSPQYVAAFQNQIQATGVKAIFFEPQLSTEALRPVAQDLGVDMLILDPLGGQDYTASYIDLMSYNLSQITSVSE